MAENSSGRDGKFIQEQVLILSGQVGEGKSSLLLKLVEELAGHIKLAGFIAEGLLEDGRRSGFMLRQIGGSGAEILAGIEAIDHRERQGRFYFRPSGFELGTQWMRAGIEKGARLLVVDEVGPMEVEGRGWSALVEEVLKTRIPMLWIVRESALEVVCRQWKIQESQIIHINNTMLSKIHKKILEHVGNYEGPAH